ncbi:MAG: transcription elongation factor GreA [Chloroflexota bacterium]|nr:transcription elongation factor GreA [Chloroflexota bacterium]
MKQGTEDISLGEAASLYLTGLPDQERRGMQQEINRFVVWYGKDRPISKVAPPEVAGYAEALGSSVCDAPRRLAPLKSFLNYAKKEGMVKASLASHLGTRKGTRKVSFNPTPPREEVMLTREAHAQMKAELASLKEERPHLAEEIRKAAEDKDFRENAPLEAAREQHEQVEARIRELEGTLQSSVIVEDDTTDISKVRLSSTVTVCDLATGDQLRYTLVSTNEIDPSNGRISSLSPVGKALMNRTAGETVQVVIPSGTASYRIEKIETCQ